MNNEFWRAMQEFEKNKKGRDYVCGDIHGCFDELEDELVKIDFDPEKDRLFCVGDLIDRGPRSRNALGYIQKPWFHSVLGNHEHMFIMANCDNPNREKYYYNHSLNGGDWIKEEDNTYRDVLFLAIKEIPVVIKIDDVLIVHAVFPPVPDFDYIKNGLDYFLEEMLWGRPAYPQKVKIPGISHTYVGHTIVKTPMTLNNVTNIDTGCFLKYRGKYGYLTIKEL
ncbi:serine/threonine protein phosphatase [Spirochaetia bacterium]|nr:serine/threonine protein phosphatase [Spirochaetia bacterium]